MDIAESEVDDIKRTLVNGKNGKEISMFHTSQLEQVHCHNKGAIHKGSPGNPGGGGSAELGRSIVIRM